MVRIRGWLEPVGLAILLMAFGWQCLEEKTAQIKMEGYLMETNEKLFAVWKGVYDEAVHSDRYQGKTLTWVNYDSFDKSFKDWSQLQKELSTIRSQESCFFIIRLFLFISGSILVIISKVPNFGYRNIGQPK